MFGLSSRRNVSIIAFFAVLIGAALWARVRFSTNPAAYREYLEGVQLAQAGRDVEAVARWEQAKRNDPTLAEAYVQVARARLRTGNPREAVSELLALQRAVPDARGSDALLATAYLRLNDLDNASAAAHRAVQREPQSAEAHAALCEVYAKNTHLTECEQELQTAQSLAPNNVELYEMGARLTRQLNMPAKCEAQARKYLALSPQIAAAHYYLAWAILHQKADAARTQTALAEFKQAVALNPTDARTLAEYGNALLTAGRTEEAIPLLEKSRQLMADADKEIGISRNRQTARASVCRDLMRAYAATGKMPQSAAMREEAAQLSRSISTQHL